MYVQIQLLTSKKYPINLDNQLRYLKIDPAHLCHSTLKKSQLHCDQNSNAHLDI